MRQRRLYIAVPKVKSFLIIIPKHRLDIKYKYKYKCRD